MPIKVTCSCGQALNVPDNLAGKTGKCPKCQSALKIPAANPTPANKGPAPSAKPAAPGAKPVATAPAAVAAQDSVFDEIGLTKKTGPMCPKCGGAVKPNTALCTSCGFNFQTGEQLVGVNTQTTGPEFKNMHLQEAAEFMRRDQQTGERHAKSGMPWWMLAALLLGALCVGVEGVVIVDGTINEPAPANTFLGRVQRQKIAVSAGITFAMVGALITTFAHMSIVAFAFGKSAGRGFGCLFVPFFALVYGIRTWADNKAALMATVWGALLIGGGLGMAFWAGWIK